MERYIEPRDRTLDNSESSEYALAPTEIGANLEDGKISESEIDSTSAPVVGGIVLWAQDKKDKKWDMILQRPSGRSAKRTIVTD